MTYIVCDTNIGRKNYIASDISKKLPKYDVKDHHKGKAQGESYGCKIRMLSRRSFRNKFFHNDIEHGSGRKGKKGRHQRHDRGSKQDDKKPADRFDGSA